MSKATQPGIGATGNMGQQAVGRPNVVGGVLLSIAAIAVAFGLLLLL